MDKCHLCGKESDQHTEKMHSFQTTQYALNFPPHVLIAKNKPTQKKAPIAKLPPCVTDEMAELLQSARDNIATEPTPVEEIAEVAEAEEPALEPEPEQETLDGVIVAFHPETSSGFIRKLDGGKGSGFFFGAENDITSGDLRVGTKVRFKTLQQSDRQFNNTPFKAIEIEIYK